MARERARSINDMSIGHQTTLPRRVPPTHRNSGDACILAEVASERYGTLQSEPGGLVMMGAPEMNTPCFCMSRVIGLGPSRDMVELTVSSPNQS